MFLTATTLLLLSVLCNPVSGFASCSPRVAGRATTTLTTDRSTTCRHVGKTPVLAWKATRSSSSALQESKAEHHDSSSSDDTKRGPLAPIRTSLRKAPGFSLTALRTTLRTATGFSWTALRTTCRAATGISFTAIYLTTLAATGNWIRQTTKFVLSIFPPWARYFVQPFLILYYVPIFILRNLTGPTRRRARKTHEAVLDSWKDAVQKADDKVAYWPIHVDAEGNFESDMGELDMRDGVMESIEVAKDEAATSSIND